MMGSFKVFGRSDWITQTWYARILAEHDTEPVELFSGTLKAVIGLWLILPFETLRSGGDGAFDRLEIGPEWLWGSIFLALGGGHLLAVRDGSRGWRRAASMTAFGVWFGLASLALWANPYALGFPFFLLLSVQQAWAYLRLGRAPA